MKSSGCNDGARDNQKIMEIYRFIAESTGIKILELVEEDGLIRANCEGDMVRMYSFAASLAGSAAALVFLGHTEEAAYFTNEAIAIQGVINKELEGMNL